MFFFLNTSAKAQYTSLSEAAEVSILTIGPGDQLYDKFGHSAFRIQDKSKGIDRVYNYGVYDFNTPNFYTKFARGKLLYQLGVSSYQPFYNSYVAQNRWIKQQTLNLTYSEKQAVFSFLQNNAKPGNREYKYDFFYDNCATKIRDVLKDVLDGDLQYNDDFVEENHTFRELIQKNLHWNTWGSLGIDVALGAVIDQQATAWEYQFLPDYIFKAAKTATITRNGNKESLVQNTETLFKNNPTIDSPFFFTSPVFVFGLLGILIVFITYKDHQNNTRSRLMDAIIFFTTGLIGVFLLLLWLATDHTATANNYNLLWAFPLSLFLSGMIAKRFPKSWLNKYVFFLIVLLGLLTMHWFTGVQVFAKALIPLLVALAIRYSFLAGFLKRQ
ncbi:Lnb N-terminal periplasmic domain-containing protein [Marixanthomonas spongiae]|uniref:Uncharacterized protein n=1 Tax=Marixanthomonas spongiae TaxID=2174845 RepID=A0A2U0I5U9_9FLAO|nr:DUF4105 domain-containing protein [Marixanthomonas spongiae]PVW16478.1 hypothetical protein DDV96_04275 [Marixanthomonas spongiae]